MQITLLQSGSVEPAPAEPGAAAASGEKGVFAALFRALQAELSGTAKGASEAAMDSESPEEPVAEAPEQEATEQPEVDVPEELAAIVASGFAEINVANSVASETSQADVVEATEPTIEAATPEAAELEAPALRLAAGMRAAGPESTVTMETREPIEGSVPEMQTSDGILLDTPAVSGENAVPAPAGTPPSEAKPSRRVSAAETPIAETSPQEVESTPKTVVPETVHPVNSEGAPAISVRGARPQNAVRTEAPVGPAPTREVQEAATTLPASEAVEAPPEDNVEIVLANRPVAIETTGGGGVPVRAVRAGRGVGSPVPANAPQASPAATPVTGEVVPAAPVEIAASTAAPRPDTETGPKSTVAETNTPQPATGESVTVAAEPELRPTVEPELRWRIRNGSPVEPKAAGPSPERETKTEAAPPVQHDNAAGEARREALHGLVAAARFARVEPDAVRASRASAAKPETRAVAEPAVSPPQGVTASRTLAASAPTAPSAPAAPAETPSAASLTEQTVRSVRQLLAQGEQSVTVRLSPPSLGEVRFEVQTSGGEVRIRVESANPSVRDAFERHLPQLRQALAQDGVVVNRVDVAPRLAAGMDTGSHLSGRGAGQGSSAGGGQSPAPYGGGAEESPGNGRPARRHPGALNVFA